MPTDTGPPYNLHIPELGDSPNVPADMAELANDVHGELARIDANAAFGWQPIDNGTHSGGAFDIDITAGGLFPAGTFHKLRFTGYGRLDTHGTIRMRVNDDDPSPTLYRTGSIAHQYSTGAVIANAQSDGAPQWILAYWGGFAGNMVETVLSPTNVADAVSYISHGSKVNSGADQWESKATGRLNADVLVSLINIRPFSDTDNLFTNLIWTLEGYRA